MLIKRLFSKLVYLRVSSQTILDLSHNTLMMADLAREWLYNFDQIQRQ